MARVDLDRTRLSAEIFENFIAHSQGAMSLRPGTKYLGSSYNDTGAEFLEFVASTRDVALLEITHNRMRVRLGEDAHDLELLSRPKVDTTLALTDTGWTDTSVGGVLVTGSSSDIIPQMTADTVNGVKVTASSQNIFIAGTSSATGHARNAADNLNATLWTDTGAGVSTLPSWWNVDFGSAGAKAVTGYTLRAHTSPPINAWMAQAWELLASDHDTGSYATDTGKWSMQDTRSGQTGWGTGERRVFATIEGDTGTVTARRHWRLYFTVSNTPSERLAIAEIEMTTTASSSHTRVDGATLVMNALAVGGLARREKRLVISDTGTEHALAIEVERGPVTLRVGSSQRDDDYVSETQLGTGYHNLAFTPQGNVWVTLQSDALGDRSVRSLAIGDSGTVEITAPWEAADLPNLRYDQSADVVYADCADVRPAKIERRGTGRSWSIVDFAPDDGPFLPAPSSSAKLSVSHFFGNTTLNSDIPLFTAEHVGSLVRVFHEGQGGQWRLGAADAKTDAVQVTGISDTGTNDANSERRITFSVSGAYAGAVTVERSIDGEDRGFKPVPTNFISPGTDTGANTDTGTFSVTVDDADDNLKVWYRARMKEYTSGVATVATAYPGGGITGVARITGFNSNTDVDVEVLSRFSDTGPSDNWQLGYWSEARGFPTAVALHGGRLGHAQGGSVFLSESDNYEGFDDAVVGDARPIIRTLGSGPVDNIHYLVSLLRLIIGTAGAELAVRSSSLDEPLTADNSGVLPFSTQGSANIRALRMDTRAIMVQRSGARVFMIGPAENTLADYEGFELTLLVPDLLAELGGVVSIAVQRQPDTRIHCVGANGKVAILTYEPQEEVICWSMWSGDTGTDARVEKAAVLPGLSEDAVFYHIRRTINGATKRYLEKWAKVSECAGDTGLTWLVDCAVSQSDTGRSASFDGIAPHLAGERVIAWGDLDTGSHPFVDLSPDVDGVQTMYDVDTGGDVALSLTEGVSKIVVGLPVGGTWKSTKLAYGAQLGTALAQMKRAPQLALCLYRTHAGGLFYGYDTGRLDGLPRMIEGARVDPDAIHAALDMVAVPVPSTWNPDARLVLKAKGPRPCTVLAVVPSVVTSEK